MKKMMNEARLYVGQRLAFWGVLIMPKGHPDTDIWARHACRALDEMISKYSPRDTP